MTTQPRPVPGALLKIKMRDRFGQIERLAGQLVTLVETHDLDDGLSDCVGYVHAPGFILEHYQRKRVQAFNLTDELEWTNERERPCPKCGAISIGARVFPDGAVLFRHGDTGHVLEAEELKP